MFVFLSFNYFIISKGIISVWNFITDIPLISITHNERMIFLYFILFAAVLIYLFSLVHKYVKIRIIFYSVISTMIVFDTISLVPHYYSYLKNEPIIDFDMPSKVNKNIKITGNNPNIYLIIIDAMPSPERVNKMFYRNYDFVKPVEYRYTKINELKNLGFKFIKNARSNTISSYSSIPHFFTMEYIFNKKEKINPNVHVEIKNFFQGFNPVVAEFRKRNYKYVRTDGTGWISKCFGIEDICITKAGISNTQDLVFLERTYFNLIINRLPEKFTRFLKINLSNIPIIPGMVISHNPTNWIDPLIELDTMEELLPNIEESPYFFHTWLPLPHHPVRFDKNCGKTGADAHEKDYEQWSINFVEQIKCTEKRMVSFAQKIIKHDKDAIIIIHSDHGMDHVMNSIHTLKYKDLPDLSFENLLGIFAAFRMPERCYEFNSDNYSPVNTFRIIFACLDNVEPTLLEYKSFLIDKKRKYVDGLIYRNNQGEYKILDFDLNKE